MACCPLACGLLAARVMHSSVAMPVEPTATALVVMVSSLEVDSCDGSDTVTRLETAPF